MHLPTLAGRSLLGGLALTLLTAVALPRTRFGATGYGLPVTWLVRRALAPEFSPWRVNWLGFLIDLAVWTATVFAVVSLLRRVGSRTAGDGPSE